MLKESDQLKFSVMIPTYNMGGTIGDTIRSVLNQTFGNFEIIVQDNASNDNTLEVIKSFADSRIKYFKNDTNIGYAGNLIEGRKNCHGDILYFLAADDILSVDALLETNRAFLLDDNIGAVTRPYFWFQENINNPIRTTPVLNDKQDEIIYIQDFKRMSCAIHNEILGQLSGLAFRMKYLEKKFFNIENIWIPHGYPFMHILKKHPVVFLKNYQLAVRIGNNNALRQRNNGVYVISPTKRWITILDDILTEKEFQAFKKYFIKKVIAANYIGLIQIKNYGGTFLFLRESWYLIKYKWTNIFNYKFWFFFIGCAIIPASLLIKMTDWYKNKVNRKVIKKINFVYNIN